MNITNGIKHVLKVGEKFDMGRNFICEVTVVDKFGCEPHYGFTFRDDKGNYRSGWMPVEFVDHFTGHIQPSVTNRGNQGWDGEGTYPYCAQV